MRADARERAAEAGARRRTSRGRAQGVIRGAALPRARPGRPLRLPAGDGARRRPRPRDRRDVHRGHRRRQPGRDLRPRHARARLRGADRLPVLLLRHRGVRRRPIPTSTACRGTTRASRTCGARTTPILSARDSVASLVTGAGGQLGQALLEAFPDARGLTRAEWDVTLPAPAGLGGRPRAAHGGVDERRRRRGRSAGGGGGERRRRAARGGARRAARRVVERLRLRRRRSATPYVESDAPAPLGAYGRSKLHGEARRRRAGVDRAHARGSSARPRTTSSARCCASAPSATRWRSSTTSAAARPTSGISPRRRRQVLELPYGIYHVAAARRLHVGGVRGGDLRGGGPRHARPPHHDRRVRRARAAARVLGAAQRARRAGAAALARGASRECLDRLG